MVEYMNKDSKNLADTPNTSAMETDALEDVHEELYASSVKTEILEDDKQEDPCSSTVKTEVSEEDVPQDFYFCAVNMDGLEDDEFKDKTQDDELAQYRLEEKRKRAAERQRRYKARQRSYAEKLKAMLASKQNEQSQKEFHCADSQMQGKSQVNQWLSNFLEQQLEKRRIKRKNDRERQRRYREAKRMQEESLKAMIKSTNENSLAARALSNSKSDIKPAVSTNIDLPLDHIQELEIKMKRRKRDRERQRKYRHAKRLKELEKLKVTIASTTSSSQSSTDESQNAIEKEGSTGVSHKKSHKQPQKELKEIIFTEDLLAAGSSKKSPIQTVTNRSQSAVKTGVSANVDHVESQIRGKHQPKKFYITQIKLGDDFVVKKSDAQSVRTYGERRNKARLNFLAAQALLNAPTQAITHESESVATQKGSADVSRKNVGSNLIENIKKEREDLQDDIV